MHPVLQNTSQHSLEHNNQPNSTLLQLKRMEITRILKLKFQPIKYLVLLTKDPKYLRSSKTTKTFTLLMVCQLRGHPSSSINTIWMSKELYISLALQERNVFGLILMLRTWYKPSQAASGLVQLRTLSAGLLQTAEPIMSLSASSVLILVMEESYFPLATQSEIVIQVLTAC